MSEPVRLVNLKTFRPTSIISFIGLFSKLRPHLEKIGEVVKDHFNLQVEQLHFDHYGIQTTSTGAFYKLIKNLSPVCKAIDTTFHHERVMLILQSKATKDLILEIAGPKPEIDYSDLPPFFIEHVAFSLTEPEAFNAMYDQAKADGTKNFDVKGSMGVKPKGKVLAAKVEDPTLKTILESLDFVEIRNDSLKPKESAIP